jgi:hypothetical protein
MLAPTALPPQSPLMMATVRAAMAHEKAATPLGDRAPLMPTVFQGRPRAGN